MASMSAAPPLQYVCDGRQCLGHMLSRGKSGIEAFDRDDKSLGLFPSPQDAADAVLVAAKEHSS
jgi:hypothetical protein